MSTPHKRLTLQAYEQLGAIIELRILLAKGMPLSIIENLKIQSRRLEQLMDALKEELLSE